ncbi:NAD-dependent epimerase/dehydratase family protein [Isosphaeraceae bacterium EP7]
MARSTLIVGCGYLGIRVGRRLAELGEVAYGTTRTPGRFDELQALGIKPVLADVLDESSLKGLPAVDRVLHCVGFDRTGGVPIADVYVDGLARVLEHLPDSVKTFVYASSTGVYGRDDGGWVDEAYPPEPRGDSGRACLAAEGLVRGRANLASVILRYSGLYGPGRVVRRASIEKGEPIPGDPEKWLNMIHIEDAASAAIAALDRPEAGNLYVATDDRPVPRREYYELVAQALGVAPPPFAPPKPGSAAAGRDDTNKRASCRKIKETLGLSWTYPDISTGVPAALRATD